MEPDRANRPRIPAWLGKGLLLLSVFPFILSGAFLVTRILRITRGHSRALTIPFIIFVALFCLAPVAQVVLVLRKWNKAPIRQSAAASEPNAVVVNSIDDGREFHFPAPRRPGAVLLVTVLAVFWAAMVWGLCYTRMTWIAPMAASLPGVGILAGLLNLWFKQIRLVVRRDRVQLARRWFFLNDTKSFEAPQILRFDSSPVPGRNGRGLCQIHFVLRNEERVVVARSIAGAAESERLVREMNDALGCQL